MADETQKPQLRQHLRDIRTALGGIGRDVKIDVSDTPHNVKEGTKNTFARAAGVRRTPMKEWSAPAGDPHGTESADR
jgi:hypothetical protein